MSAASAVGEAAPRVPSGVPEDALKLLAGDEGPRRRSLRKREGKSYAEFGEADFNFIEDENSEPGSPMKGMNNQDGKNNPGNVANSSVSANSRQTNNVGNAEKTLSNGDVEMESDDEDEDDGPLEPLPPPKELPPELELEKKALIRQLQTRLRNEEMSLVLLKKIRQSQVLAEQAKEASKVSIQPANSVKSHRGTPPLPQNSKKPVTNSASSRPGSGGQSMKTPDLSLLKPVNVDPKSLTTHGLPANLVSLMKGGLGATQLTEVSKTQKMDTETPAQKQAAAKLALRKQLEKTLLQIPPPKPPPPEMHFIPNPANTEFICLLGLEECVSKILNEDKENSIQPVPFSCSQCGTDFTPTWKWDKAAKGKEVKVICESCVTTNVKKALKAEHTNRLKAAFVKALQQEQELEAHMASTSSSSTSSSTTAARIASPDSRARNSVDVTVRPSPSSRSSIPSAHSKTSAATVERNPYRSSGSSNLPRSGGSSSTLPARTISSNSRQSYNNGGLSTSHRSQSSSSSKSSDLANANAMAAQVAALMGMGAYGGDPAASMALLQAAAAQQQLLMGGLGGSSGSSNSTSGSSSRTTNSSSSRGGSSSAAGSNSNDLNSQLAAMNQLLNPMTQMYNYQAMAAMMAAMGGSSGGGSSSTSSTSKTSSASSSSSATNQMLELQRQAERLQQQYLLDMIPPGSLGSSWGASGGSKK